MSSNDGFDVDNDPSQQQKRLKRFEVSQPEPSTSQVDLSGYFKQELVSAIPLFLL